MIDEDIINGIKVLALVHSGKLKLDCDNCINQNELSCGKISNEIVFENEDLVLYTCPLFYVNRWILDFYDEYSYYEAFPGTAPKYGEHSVRFWECVKIYKRMYNKYSMTDSKEKSVEDTSLELGKLRKNFEMKKKRK